MGQLKNSTTGAAIQPVPLFASSWVALFRHFQENLGKKREDDDQIATEEVDGRDGNVSRH